MTIYVKCTRDGNDCYMSYVGQDADTITRLLTDLGATNIQFIQKDEWMAANPPRVMA